MSVQASMHKPTLSYHVSDNKPTHIPSSKENMWPNLTLARNLDRRVQMSEFVFCSQWYLIQLRATTSATQPVQTILLYLFWIWRYSVKSEKTMTSWRLSQQSFPHKIRGQIGHEMQFSGGQKLWGHSAMFGLQKKTDYDRLSNLCNSVCGHFLGTQT